MANSKTRLGRGLGGLIAGAGGTSAASSEKAATSVASKGTSVSSSGPKKSSGKPSSEASISGYQEILVKDLVTNPYQPRREVDAQQVEELAKSIESEGLLQPIVVRSLRQAQGKQKDKKFELIAGERRFRAFQYLERTTIPARIIEASDASSAAIALIENLQRENLNPIDEAMGYASLIRDFDLTQEAAADRVGKGRATVANALRLLSLGSEIQGFLSRRLISTGHAKVLLGINDETHRKLLARRIIERRMSVREAEEQVRSFKESSRKSSKRQVPVAETTAVRDLERRLSEHLNTRVGLKHGPKKGKITTEYFGNDDLDRILEKIGVAS